MKKNYPAKCRTIQMEIDVEHLPLASNKGAKSDYMNRKDVCNYMGWSNADLNNYIKYHDFPRGKNRFSRSAVKAWEESPISFGQRTISIEHYFIPQAS